MNKKMSRSIVLWMILILIVSVAGCANRGNSKDSAEPVITKEYKVGNISFLVPQNWVYSENNGDLYFYTSEKNSDQYMLIQEEHVGFEHGNLPIKKEEFESQYVNAKDMLLTSFKDKDATVLSTSTTEFDGFLIGDTIVVAQHEEKVREYRFCVLIDNQSGFVYHFSVTFLTDLDSETRQKIILGYENAINSIQRQRFSTSKQSFSTETVDYSVGHLSFKAPKSWKNDNENGSLSFTINKNALMTVVYSPKLTDRKMSKDDFEKFFVESYKDGIVNKSVAKDVVFLSSEMTLNGNIYINRMTYNCTISRIQTGCCMYTLLDNNTGDMYVFGFNVQGNINSSKNKEGLDLFEHVMNSLEYKE